jgi:hypothetical protein
MVSVYVCDPTQGRSPCANDALFTCLMRYCTPMYIIEGVCAYRLEEMAVRVDSVMVGLL